MILAVRQHGANPVVGVQSLLRLAVSVLIECTLLAAPGALALIADG
jgi:hypothetical protein